MRTEHLAAICCLWIASCGGDALPADGGASDAAADGPSLDTGTPRDLGPDTTCPDADGDGHSSTTCGGDDCDDADPQRYPGHAEVCDAAGHDEDCNPTTLGPDGDGDGFVSVACCNHQPTSVLRCGTDCDDGRATVNPTAVEACNGVDDNCNGLTDDGAGLLPDCDHDSFGDPASTRSATCSPAGAPSCAAAGGAWAMASGDCDDTRAAVYPGAIETCNGVDDDCNGTVDDATATATWCNDVSRALAHATAACTSGACVVSACAGTFLDCTPDPGCETDPVTSGLHCGSCDHPCAWGCNASACDDPVHISAGSIQTAVTTASGAVDWWGFDYMRSIALPSPIPVPGITDAVAVAACYAHMCALRAGGGVVCWGYNDHGELGDGSTTNSATPVAVSGLTDAVEIACGDDAHHTCARRMSGAVVCWGANEAGQLGDGTTADRHAPVAVTGLVDAVGIAGADQHTCARRTGGGVYCWGSNAGGQLGDGGVTHSTCVLPSGPADCSLATVGVSGVTDAVEVAGGTDYGCARRLSGTVGCWGDNFYGQLGDGSTTASSVPVAVSSLTDAVEIAIGYVDTCARRATGAVICWGYNAFGELGDGTMTDSAVPVMVSGLTDAVEISVGHAHGCAIRASGGVVCWGNGSYGELTMGLSRSLTPVPIHMP